MIQGIKNQDYQNPAEGANAVCQVCGKKQDLCNKLCFDCASAAQEACEERAAIIEYDGGLDRETARRLTAYAYLKQHGTRGAEVVL